ncbi:MULTISPECIES: hypothetical protein [Ralstonia]|jgi:hypothetical protein|uniref:Uncharacterized protein n=1 Tax=Ralstonia flaminis TaxID=3058597 RepID=A0ABN9JNY5_9RALS|nr:MULTISPECIES: hypothetical protein [unclassified Ralstonia]CAJ0819437.1 hypothetical protein LMG18101_03947 [Ralstonia sp. LMG 18101]
MDQTDYLLRLASRMRQATLKRDIDAIERLNREVHDVAAAMGRDIAMSKSERESLALLKVAHQAAIALITSESKRLIETMGGLRTHRAGWEAYAAVQRSGR